MRLRLAVECEIAIALGLSIGFGGNYRRDFSLCKAIDERISVVGLVCDQGMRIGIFNQAWAQAKSWIWPAVSIRLAGLPKASTRA